MQFILTLLISVRGRGLLKDSSDVSFFGGRGWADRHRRSQEAWPGGARGPRGGWAGHGFNGVSLGCT